MTSAASTCFARKRLEGDNGVAIADYVSVAIFQCRYWIAASFVEPMYIR